MAYSKHDFSLSWFRNLLGEYTCSDIECSDNEGLPECKQLKQVQIYVYTSLLMQAVTRNIYLCQEYEDI